ncbi:helix-turn-helix domain-containing protein [Actinophytocola sediminis]
MNSGNASRARALGAELREARKRAGMTMETLGDRLGRSHSDISRWENGRRLPKETDTATVLGILGVTGDERDRLLQLAHDAADPNWVAPGVDKQLAALIEDEKTARSIVNVQPLIIPGLLQTEEYARAIMLGAGATRGQADHRVLVRLGRQAVLERRRAPKYLAIIGEHALRHPSCVPEVMAEQLHYLLKKAEKPNVTIEVLPIDIRYTPALEGPFVLLEFDRGDPVVQQEHFRSTTTLTDIKDVRDYQTAVDMIRRETMSEDESAKLITELMTEMERAT